MNSMLVKEDLVLPTMTRWMDLVHKNNVNNEHNQ